MFIAVLFIIVRTWKQPRFPSTEKWINKLWYIYTMYYYLAEKNDILKFAGKWMDLENIILSEVTQAQKDSDGIYSLISGSKTKSNKYPSCKLQLLSSLGTEGT